jgi:hypothetical protein
MGYRCIRQRLVIIASADISSSDVFVRPNLSRGTVEQVPFYPQVNFFPASRALMEGRLQTASVIRHTFEDVGLRTIACRLVTQQVAPNYAVFAQKNISRCRLGVGEFESG